MRGYFAAGVDGISKPMNLGNLLRIAHAFDASFFFTVNAQVKLSDAQSDTSRAQGSLPFYPYRTIEEFRLPVGCRLVGVEITDDGVGGAAPPGNGLSGLCERVAAAGGVVDAGPLKPTGWRLRVQLAGPAR